MPASHSDSNEAVEPILDSNISRSATSPVSCFPWRGSKNPHKCQVQVSGSQSRRLERSKGVLSKYRDTTFARKTAVSQVR